MANMLAAQYSISGKVTTAVGTPVVGADIHEQATGTLTSSNPNGAYSIKNLPSGDYIITIYSFEHNVYTTTVTISDSDVKLELET